MKVVCERQALLSAVNAVAPVVPLRTPSPALSCLRIVAAKTGQVSEIHLAGTDNETSLDLSFSQVDVVQPGTAIVPAEKLRQIVQAMEGATTLTIESEGDVCHIKGEGAKFKIFAYPSDQFPAIPDFAQVAGGGPGVRGVFTHHAGGLQTLVNRTVFATARETSRYAINGVLMKRDGKKVEMVATDGRRLALCRATVKAGESGGGGAGGGSSSCIIPTKALNMFMRLAGNPDETVRVVVTDNRVFFAFEEGGEDGKSKAPARTRAVLSSTLVEGAFPPYEDVIPKDQDKKITAAREELIAAVREAAILTNEESRGVRMSFNGKKKQLRLTSRAPEMGESEIDVGLSAYDGDDVEISFNPQYLADALKSIDEPEVVIELKASNKPGLVRGGSDFVYVVMPVNLPA